LSKWIDLHAHLNFLDVTPKEALDQALSAGVERIITIATCSQDHQTVLDLADEFSPYVYCTLGVHPHDANEYSEDIDSFIRSHCGQERVVAIGEIGLDYYYDNSPRDKQLDVFQKQLNIAIENKLPVQIHTRDAEKDTIAMLHPLKGQVSGAIHCFTGTMELAKAVLDIGLNISISGVVTFKNAEALREVVRYVPLERLHVETDSPFLTPVPFRGKKNQPAMVVHTAEMVAKLKDLSLDELSRATHENALRIFSKIKWQ